MALKKPTTAADTSSKFESEMPEAVAPEATAPEAVAPAQEAPAQEASAAVEVHVVLEAGALAPAPAAAEMEKLPADYRPSTMALSRNSAAMMLKTNVLSVLKDAFRVEFDSLPALMASQGSFSFKDTEQELGGSIDLQLLSYQDGWVASPNDDTAPKELVLYSEDGKFSRDGVDLRMHIQDLIEQGYSKSRIVHRVTLVGELLGCAVDGISRVGELVLIDMPETGRKSFNTYTLQASYGVGKGRYTADQATLLKLTAVKDKTAEGKIYTKIVTSIAPTKA